MTASSTHDQHVSSTATAAGQECDIAPTTCSDVVEHEDRLRAPTLTSLSPSQAPACGAAGGSQNEAILIPTDSESESMSESDGETDDDVQSLKKTHERIDKETTTQPISASPASTIATVPNTPRALSVGSEVDDHLSAPVQRSPSPTFLTTSVLSRQGPRDGLDSSRRSPATCTTEIAEQDHGQTEDASEPLSSQCDNHEPGGPAELPRRTQPHGSAIQNDSASIDGDGDGKTAEEGGRDSYSDSSDSSDDNDDNDDNDGGNDGDDDNYNDDGSSSDTDADDGGYSKKRGIDRSPSASSFDSGHADGPADDNVEEKPARSHKRQKVAHDRASITLPLPNSMPCSAGRLSRSPERPQTASMPSPPASHGLSETESDKGSNCSKASTASFGEWLLQNAALKCVTIDGVDTYQLQFQRAPMHSCSRRQERQPHTVAEKSRGGRKPRDETKSRLCGVCKKSGHNARTCQEKKNDTNPIDLAR